VVPIATVVDVTYEVGENGRSDRMPVINKSFDERQSQSNDYVIEVKAKHQDRKERKEHNYETMQRGDGISRRGSSEEKFYMIGKVIKKKEYSPKLLSLKGYEERLAKWEAKKERNPKIVQIKRLREKESSYLDSVLDMNRDRLNNMQLKTLQKHRYSKRLKKHLDKII